MSLAIEHQPFLYSDKLTENSIHVNTHNHKLMLLLYFTEK